MLVSISGRMLMNIDDLGTLFYIAFYLFTGLLLFTDHYYGYDSWRNGISVSKTLLQGFGCHNLFPFILFVNEMKLITTRRSQ